MKSINKLLVFSFLMVAMLQACKKDENRIYFEGGTPPVLTASVTNDVPLSFVNQTQEALKLSWTNPEYKFTTGTSSQNVNYQIEIDTVGANFTNPNRVAISINSELSKSFTQFELNEVLLNQMQLKVNMPHQLEMRVKAFLGSNAVLMTSNALKFTVTPFSIPPKITPPASGRLFIIGAATPGGWDNPVPASQELTKVSETLYEITINLAPGGPYLFIPVNGSWDAKYGAIGANLSNNPNGDDFKPGGGDLIAPAAGGTYKVEVDFQRGKFILTKI